MNEEKPDETLNLAGVPCPTNFVRTLLKLEGMESGSILEIVIDDGEPIENVPPEVEEEGHEILSTTKLNGQWRLLVRRE